MTLLGGHASAAVSGDGRKEKLGEQVARRIEDDIVARGWPVGEVLGSEAELTARYGVSRAALREAISILEYKQVAAMRRGRGGGLVVRAPAAAVVAEAVAAFFHFADVSADELYEARITLEVLAARLAARRIEESDIAALREVTATDTPERPLSVAIARVAGNPVLTIFIPTLTRVTGALAVGPAGRTDGFALGEGVKAERDRALTAIAEAVISGDEATAERRVRTHLLGERAWLERVLADQAESRARAVAEQPDSLAERLARSPVGKLPERIALLIRQEIHQRGWPAGEVIGGEAALCEELGVSRAVFREAVRILEHNGVARMRQGPGGGLVVLTPDPARVVDALALYLRYLRVGAADLFEVRTAVELKAVELAAAVNGRDAAGAERLAESLEHERVHSDAPPAYADLHVALAQLSGNRLLTLFTAVLSRLTPFRLPRDDVHQRRSLQTHEKIAEAVLSGDASLARHRMSRHLEALTPWLDDSQP
ncbi:DNA-binding transcriptional regulator, FadR family [Thermomonospora echinospora]|uniref:DNA-binding transcriptional regulator, FadR family n=1 Tax=Thermomonospora echinospora TaxID=1992 RepID=A0A1H6DTP0_9ACTN|nr:FCD domain-containing protein [Thermomonospora echinospora]SEG88638.1 DNA-binding transcriptional regulator, FadR family [Thermomonospora echinospora]